MADEMKNELVVSEQEGHSLSLWGPEGTQYMTSLKDSPEDIDKRVACMSSGPSRLRGYVGQKIDVVDWFIHPVTRINDNTGETWVGPRLVMILDSGEMVSTSSKSVISTLGHLLSLTGFKAFDPPRAFAVGEVKTTGSKAYLTLTPVVKKKGK